jgi:hypothetical protein
MEKLEKGVGINIQILNGDYKALRFLVVSGISFVLDGNAGTDPLLVDLSNDNITGLVNRGYGITDEGVTQSGRGLEFEIVYEEFTAYPMFAIDFSGFLQENDVRMEDVESFEIVAALYDKDRTEIDLSSEFQKCAFVSRDALDGYSDSDILPVGNYKQIGSSKVTEFDLTTYTGYTSDETTLTESSLDEGVGFNLQIINGDYSRLRYLTISKLKFNVKKEVEEEMAS